MLQLMLGTILITVATVNAFDLTPILLDLDPLANAAGHASDIIITARDNYLARLEKELAFIDSKLAEIEALPQPVDSFKVINFTMQIIEHTLPLMRELLQPDGLVQSIFSLIDEVKNNIIAKADKGMVTKMDEVLDMLRPQIEIITKLINNLETQLLKFSNVVAVLAKLNINNLI